MIQFTGIFFLLLITMVYSIYCNDNNNFKF